MRYVWIPVVCALAACVDGTGEAAMGSAAFTAADPSAPYVPPPATPEPQPQQPTPQAPMTPEPPTTTPEPTTPATAGTGAPMTPDPAGTAGMTGAAGTAGTAGATPTEPTAGTGGEDPLQPDPVTPDPAAGPSEGTLTVSFTSVGHGGRYQPRNIGAVWIETADGQFVKTIKRWAGIRAGDLTHWNAVSGGWGFAGFFGGGSSGDTPDQVDAVTGATLRTHEMHSVTWNMKTGDGAVVPDGAYKLMIEVTEDSRGPYAGVEFQKGPEPQMVSAPDQPPFRGLTLNYQP